MDLELEKKLRQCFNSIILRDFWSFVFLGAVLGHFCSDAQIGAERFEGRHPQNVGSIEPDAIVGPGRQQAHWADSAGARGFARNR